MVSEILKECVRKGFLLDKEVFELLKQLEDSEAAKEIINKINSISKEHVITKSLFKKESKKIQSAFSTTEEAFKKSVEKFFINLGLSLEVTKEKVEIEQTLENKEEKESNVKVISPLIIPSKKLEVGDFVKYFRVRFGEIRKFLQERSELQNLVSINKINGNKQGISIIGIVLNKRVTKNKNILLEVEDLTGKISALVNVNKPEVYNKAKNVLLDDIIGLRCSGNREIVFVNDIVYPEIYLSWRKYAKEEGCALFTSDIHVGSTNFLEKNFLKFIDWLNGKANLQEEVKKVKYLFITGDLVDGVGVFPGQENLLEIKDIEKQYEKLTEYLSQVPKHIKIIICPGQHDGVRVAEPQPYIDEKYASSLHSLPNVYLVSNPSLVKIGADGQEFMVLIYHGASFHSIIDEIEELRINRGQDNPTKVAKELLKRRHLAPSHSSVDYIPNDKEDSLIIREVPDIFATGELHRSDVDVYNNILIISSSCWQSLTPYEEKLGNNPDPCKVPMLNLKTREIKILDFS